METGRKLESLTLRCLGSRNTELADDVKRVFASTPTVELTVERSDVATAVFSTWNHDNSFVRVEAWQTPQPMLRVEVAQNLTDNCEGSCTLAVCLDFTPVAGSELARLMSEMIDEAKEKKHA